MPKKLQVAFTLISYYYLAFIIIWESKMKQISYLEDFFFEQINTVQFFTLIAKKTPSYITIFLNLNVTEDQLSMA